MPLSTPVTAAAVERAAGPLGRVAVASMQGVRNDFEDAHFLDVATGVCGVFDGHLGDEAAAFCAERLHLHVACQGEPTPESLAAAFLACDRELEAALPAGCEAGSTATLAVVRQSGEDIRVLVASCGDSRAVLWRKADGSLEATRDHRPGDEEERRRIEAAGGIVSEDFDPPRIDGQLACSRALGAFKYKAGDGLAPSAQKVSVVPETYKWMAKPGDWLLLACDGVWDVFSSQRVVDEVCKAGGDLGEVLQQVLELCIEKEADDNLTLMAVELGGAPTAERVLTVSPGNFLKAKDREVLGAYGAFCRRFGYHLEREARPKAPPVASLSPADPEPGMRFDKLPPPAQRSVGAPAEGPLVIKVTTKRSAAFYARAARELIAGKGPAGPIAALELQGWGNAVPIVVSVAAELLSDGHKFVRIETALVEVETTVSTSMVEVPQLRAVFQKGAAKATGSE